MVTLNLEQPVLISNFCYDNFHLVQQKLIRDNTLLINVQKYELELLNVNYMKFYKLYLVCLVKIKINFIMFFDNVVRTRTL